mmetsp:Transcript_37223/g.45453  ORF Transcript_37223/g.45453 Transcript_37223/m.45453 type:complete len:121 (-) Transcript_37223:176-538(-)
MSEDYSTNTTQVKLKSRSPSRVKNFFMKVDLFAEGVPGFNLGGEDRFPTINGSFFSVFILAIMVIYAAIQADRLLKKSNHNITFFEEEFAYDESEVLNFFNAGIRLAFQVDSFNIEEVFA